MSPRSRCCSISSVSSRSLCGGYRPVRGRSPAPDDRLAADGGSLSAPTWLLEEEFGRRRTPTANGVEREQGQAADETPPKTTRTPLEFKDDETGEHFDVVQDGDLSPDPGEDSGDEARSLKAVQRKGSFLQPGPITCGCVMPSCLTATLDASHLSSSSSKAPSARRHLRMFEGWLHERATAPPKLRIRREPKVDRPRHAERPGRWRRPRDIRPRRLRDGSPSSSGRSGTTTSSGPRAAAGRPPPSRGAGGSRWPRRR
jgi:hypothetical protein